MITPSIAMRVALLLLILSQATACSYNQSTIASKELSAPRTVTVIPYKASPILVDATYSSALAIFGILPTIIGAKSTEAATRDERGKVAEYLNNSAAAWDSSTAAAEECLAILRARASPPIANSSIVAITELPGIEAPNRQGLRKFTENFDELRGWNTQTAEFRNENSSFARYKKEHPDIKTDWALEVLTHIQFSNEKMYYLLYLKLMNAATNERLALGRNEGRYPLSLQEGYGLDAFDRAFRKSSQQACREALRDMGLIAK